MEKIFIVFVATLFQSFICFAQNPCDAVSVTVVPMEPQGGQYNYFGVRVSIAQPYNQDITVSGYIYEEGSPNTNNPYTLTIPAGETSAETGVYFFAACPACGANANITSVSVCPNGFNEAAAEYLNRLQNFFETASSFFQDWNDEQIQYFFNSLDQNGVNPTATAFNMNPQDVQTIAENYNLAHLSFCNAATSLYGNVESIDSYQLSNLVTSLNDYLKISLPIGPCEDELKDCLDEAKDNYGTGITACYLGGLSIATAAPVFGLIGGVGCLAYNSYTYNRAKGRCHRAYNRCIQNH